MRLATLNPARAIGCADTAGRIEKFKNKFAAAGYASLGKAKKNELAAAAAEKS